MKKNLERKRAQSIKKVAELSFLPYKLASIYLHYSPFSILPLGAKAFSRLLSIPSLTSFLRSNMIY